MGDNEGEEALRAAGMNPILRVSLFFLRVSA
jgi:hypothetical protein